MSPEKKLLVTSLLTGMTLSLPVKYAESAIGVQGLKPEVFNATFDEVIAPPNLPKGTVLATRPFDITGTRISTSSTNKEGYLQYRNFDQVYPLSTNGLGIKVTFDGEEKIPFGVKGSSWAMDHLITRTQKMRVDLVTTEDFSSLSSGGISGSARVDISWKVPGCNGSAYGHAIGTFLDILSEASSCNTMLPEDKSSQLIVVNGSIKRIIGDCTFVYPPTVTLPQMVTSALTASGGEGGETPFTIGFTGCQGDIRAVKISLSTPTLESETVAKGTDATNVGIQILRGTTPVKFSNSAAANCSTTGANCIELASSGSGDVTDFDSNMIVRYKAFGSPQAGAISIPVVFTVHYE